MRLIALVLALGACGGAKKVVNGPHTEADARAAVNALIDAQNAAFMSGDAGAWSATFAEDAFLYGPDPIETLIGRERIAAEMGRDLERFAAYDISHEITAANRDVGVAPDGRSAWVTEELTLTIKGRDPALWDPDPLLTRVTQLVAERDGRWVVLAAHWSYGGLMPDGEVAYDLAEPRDVGRDTGPGAEPLVTVVEAIVANPAALTTSWSPRPTASSVLLEERTRGEAPAELVGEYLKATAWTRKGGTRAALAPGGKVGWVAMNLEIVIGHDRWAPRLPTRALFVLLEERPGVWQIVQAHLSVPVRDVEEDEPGFIEAATTPERLARCQKVADHLVKLLGVEGQDVERDEMLRECLAFEGKEIFLDCILEKQTLAELDECRQYMEQD